MAQTTTERTAANVRAELARARISIRSAARTLDWSPNTLSRRLRGETPLTVDELLALAALLGVPLSTLLPEPEKQAS